MTRSNLPPLPRSGEGDGQRDEEAALLLRDMLHHFAFRNSGDWWVARESASPMMDSLYRAYEHCKAYGLVEDVPAPTLQHVSFFRFLPPLPESR